MKRVPLVIVSTLILREKKIRTLLVGRLHNKAKGYPIKEGIHLALSEYYLTDVIVLKNVLVLRMLENAHCTLYSVHCTIYSTQYCCCIPRRVYYLHCPLYIVYSLHKHQK